MNSWADLFSPQTLGQLQALIQLGLALYILVLNSRHRFNRAVAMVLIFLDALGVLWGQLAGASSAAAARWLVSLLAALQPLLPLGLLYLTSVALQPAWFVSRRRLVTLGLVVGLLVPGILTALDSLAGTRLWYTGLDPRTYPGGYVPLNAFTQGQLAWLIRLVWLGGGWLAALGMAAVMVRDRSELPRAQRYRAAVLAGGLLCLLLWQGLRLLWPLGLTGEMVTITGASLLYVYLALWQVATGQVRQRGRLQFRLTGLAMAVILPLLVALALVLSNRAVAILQQAAFQNLESVNRQISAGLEGWFALQAQSLRQLVLQPEVISMDSERLPSAVQTLQRANPDLDLIVILDSQGQPQARSDWRQPEEQENYGFRAWFLKARSGVPLVLDTDTLATAAGRVPALVIALPIWQEERVVGVAMGAINLGRVTTAAGLRPIGQRGYVYVVDPFGRAVIHPNPLFAARLQDLSNELPVARLLSGQRGILPPFVGEGQQIWLAYVGTLSNGWGVIVQQPQAEVLAAVGAFQAVARVIGLVGAILVALTIVVTVRQALLPIGELTRVATEVASGELEHQAPVRSEDELGTLAEAFNTMVTQLRSLISSLEQQVAERTRQAEFRAQQIQVASEVARDAATARDLETLLNRAVNLVRSRFGFYHAGIFLVDERGEYAVLRAATGEAGRQLLAQGHRLKVGETGIVGYVTKTGQPRIALDVGTDAIHFKNPLLPDTHSEMALPLRIGERIIGALDVQSTVPAAFSEDDVVILQLMADQLAVAIENVRLVDEAQRAYQEMEAVYGRYTREAWAAFSGQTTWGYLYRGLGVEAVTDQPPEVQTALWQGQTVQRDAAPGQRSTLAVPIRLRREIVGVLNVRFEAATVPPEAVPLVEELANRLALSMENARLLAESRNRALREQQIGEITARIRAEMDLEALLERALRELGQLLDARQAVVQLEVKS